jgi:hypothetical protein
MTKTQMIKAIQGYDEAMLLVDEMKKAVARGDDAILNLIEQMKVATREDTVTDVLIDLKDSGYDEAAKTIQVNYLP